MEILFRVYNIYFKTKVYLLDDCGEAEYGNISKWVKTLTTTGVGYGSVTFIPVCNFECDNIILSVKAVITSITIEMWDTIEKYLGYDASGSEVFFSIIQKQQQVNCSAVCALVQALEK